MYKVFVNNFPIFLASPDESINIKNDIVDINCDNAADAKEIVKKHILTNGKKLYVVRNADPDKLWNLFFSTYVPVKAAGGLVINEKNELLFIFRNNRWDLPKGKIDPGEDEKTAALREVKEECGLSGHTIEKKLLNTYHTYPFEKGLAIKTTCWFLMRVKNAGKLKPQTEEGITLVEWKTKNDWKNLATNTYGSIEDVMDFYLEEGNR